MASRDSVVLLQLPPPARGPADFPNVPLAPAYLAATALGEGLGSRFEIEILSSPSSDLWGDRRIVEEIASRRPVLAGFSLYPWNCTRSLFVAGEVKRLSPNTLVIVGGPEAVGSSPALLGAPGWDAAVRGEGERAFCEILGRLSAGIASLDGVGGVLNRRDGALLENPPRPPLLDLDEIPSPYLEGILHTGEYGYLWMETARGCPFRCSYCSEWERGGGGIASFSAERVAREFGFLRDRGARKIFMLDSAFNLSPRFREVCTLLASMNDDGGVSLHATLRPELIDEDAAELLKAAGVTTAELGLQCTSAGAFRALNRACDPEGYLRGASLLKREGIRVFTDVMVGIPGQTREDVAATIEFLQANAMGEGNAAVSAFPLSVCPGTELRRRSEELGIVHQSEPPYYALKSGDLAFGDIRDMLELYSDAFPNNRFDRGPRRPFLTTLSQARYPYAYSSSADACGEDAPLVYMEVVPGALSGPAEEWRRLGEELTGSVGERLTVLVRRGGDGDFLMGLRALLAPISRGNPFLIWSFLWEVGEPVELEPLLQATSSLTHREHNVDFLEVFRSPSPSGGSYRRAAIHCILVPHSPGRRIERWLEGLGNDLYVFRKIIVAPETDVGGEVDGLRGRRWHGLVVDYSPSCDREFVLRSLESLRAAETADRAVHFRNWVLHRHFHLGRGVSLPGPGSTRFVILGGGGGPLYAGLSRERLILDQAEWMAREEGAIGS